jgi:peptidoglycan/xylan/chitin deacetylase (PgdA/CDA1 family)
VENHSHRHRWSFALQGIASLRDDVRRAQDVLTHLTGRAPVFFRAPFGIRNPWVEPILHSLDLHLVSWTRRGYDAVIGNPAIVGPLLTRGLQAGEIVLLHDGGGARNRQGGPVVLDVLPRLLDEMAHQGLVARSLGEGPFEEPPDVGD